MKSTDACGDVSDEAICNLWARRSGSGPVRALTVAEPAELPLRHSSSTFRAAKLRSDMSLLTCREQLSSEICGASPGPHCVTFDIVIPFDKTQMR